MCVCVCVIKRENIIKNKGRLDHRLDTDMYEEISIDSQGDKSRGWQMHGASLFGLLVVCVCLFFEVDATMILRLFSLPAKGEDDFQHTK